MSKKTLALIISGFLVCAASGCSDDSGGDGYTVVMVTVEFDPQTYSIDQFRFEGYEENGSEAFPPGLLPETAGHLFTTNQETVAIIVSDNLAGNVLRIRAHGLNQGQVEGSGQSSVTPVLHDTVEVVVTIGDPAVCGDQLIRTGIEECDDGNVANDDGCSVGCVLEEGWVCAGSPSVCTPICGDGLVRGGEVCDDGNLADDDGCSSACAVEQGWTCDQDEPSVCAPICGDGLIRGGEPCDDGNTDPDDGCASDCQVEAGWNCTGEPSVCIFPCDEHSQCDHICDIPSSVCVAEEDILFVDCDNTCDGVGTLADPFCSLDQTVTDATQSGQFILVLPGTCTEFVDVDLGVNIIGQPGAVIHWQNCPAVRINAGPTRIEGMVIEGHWVGSRFDGGGVEVRNGAEVTLVGNQIIEGGCEGVDCDGSTCVIHGNLIQENAGGGIRIDNTHFSIINNIIVLNGDTGGSVFGGVRIDASGADPAEFINNTVADNVVDTGVNNPGAVRCLTSVDVVNCILWANDNDEVSLPECSVSFSDVDQVGFNGMNGNITADPVFLGGGDYHIDPINSPCIDTASATDAPRIDFDGDARPMGNGIDMGADEAA